MKLPRIHSISTVGIVKHYNQDYLIHPTRTDFIGGNGIGKSIIADLLQLMFVYENIEFGTKGFKQDDRKYYTLPYGTNEAFTFLNIEVFKDKFVTIGVCIPNKDRIKIKPFVIVKSENLRQNLSDLAYDKVSLITHSHFIKNKSFLNAKELSKHIRNEYGLYFLHFSKNDRDSYYSFLFEKEILPINLSIEKDLNAFSKIIQSFSKADTLDVNNSDSLKGFLFEDAKEEDENLFNQYKTDLEDLIHRFKSTKAYIADLNDKQQKLADLQQKEAEKLIAYRKWLENEVYHYYYLKNEASTAFEKSKTKLENAQKQESQLREKQTELAEAIKTLDSEIQLQKKSLKYLREYKVIHDKIVKLKRQKNELLNSKPPTINEEINCDVNIEDFGNQEIIKKIATFNLIYTEYGSITSINKTIQQQVQIINKHRNNLKKQISQCEHILDLLDVEEKGTVFSKIIESNINLSLAQESVLFHFLDMSWQKPQYISKHKQYTNTLSILDKNNIREDVENDGFWFRMGEIYEFIPVRKEKRFFENIQELPEIITQQKADLTKKKSNLKKELSRLTLFEQGKIKGEKFAIEETEFDNNLYGYSVQNQIEETAAIIQVLDGRISAINVEVEDLQHNLKECEKNIEVSFDNENIENSISELEKLLETNEVNHKIYIGEKGDVKGQLKILTNTTIPSFTTDFKDKKEVFNTVSLKYLSKENSFKKEFSNYSINPDTHKTIKAIDLQAFETKKQNTETKYIAKYTSILNAFDETKNQNNIEINTSIENNLYSFSLLENVLLGEIKYTHKIGDSLEDANELLHDIIDSMYITMVKIFKHTKKTYKDYEKNIRRFNSFFKDQKRRINKKYFLQINFDKNANFDILWIDKLQNNYQSVYRKGEFPMGKDVESFVEDFFLEATDYENKISFSNLLDPKTYFELSIRLTDADGNETGSTGQAYAAIILLGIARLSEVEAKDRKGIRFMILEEMASLDKTNFKTFPNIAEEFGYQIFTMTPEPYRSTSTDGWYLYQLLPGKKDDKINYKVPCSYFRTNNNQIDLQEYLKSLKSA